VRMGGSSIGQTSPTLQGAKAPDLLRPTPGHDARDGTDIPYPPYRTVPVNRLHRLICRSGPWRRVARRWLLPWALEGLELDEHVLELGPGPGMTTEVLRRPATRLTALEVDPRLAASLRGRLKSTNAEVVRGDAMELPFPDRSFSAVLSFTVLCHVPSVYLQDRLLAEAWRVLRPEGVFAGTGGTPNPLLRLTHLGDTMVPVDPSTFGERLRVAGLALRA
jgi:SAM-dependent methyltransferase